MTPEPMRWYAARPPWQLVDIVEVWRYRDLIWAFGMRDLRVRYRQTIIGVIWAVLQPLLTVIVFGVFISWLKGTAFDGSVPYVVTSLCGMVPWQFFAASTTQATLSIASNSELLKKVYFPRIILPLSAFVPAAVDFLVASAMLSIVMAYFGIVPGWAILAFPLLVAATILTAASFAVWLSALNGIYRDVQFAIPFAMQLGMMVSPVVYETNSVVPEKWQPLYFCNPLAGLIQCYRAVLLAAPMPGLSSLLMSLCCVVIILFTGLLYFRRVERNFCRCWLTFVVGQPRVTPTN